MRKFVAVIFSILVTVAACDDSPPTTGPDPGPGPNPGGPEFYTLQKLSGDGQTGTPGTELADPYVVKVVDPAGGSVPEATVWFLIDGNVGGSLSSSTVLTDSAGNASVTVTLPDASNVSQTVIVQMDSATNSLSFTSSTTLAAGGAASIRIVSGNGQKGIVRDTLLDPLVVEVTNPEGITVAGVSVKWGVISSEGGSIRETPTTTDGQGLASNRWRVGNLPGGTEQVIAWIEPSNADPDTVTFTASTTGVPDTIVIVQGAVELDNIYHSPEVIFGDTVFVAPGHWARQPFKGIVKDADGRTVRGAILTWTVTDSEGMVGLEPEDGEEEIAVTLNTAEDGGITVWRMACGGELNESVCSTEGRWIGATLSIDKYPDVTPITLDAMIRE
jgi:hypothetical protein